MVLAKNIIKIEIPLTIYIIKPVLLRAKESKWIGARNVQENSLLRARKVDTKDVSMNYFPISFTR